MSRKGKMPISLPKGVEIEINQDCVTVKGPKGSLMQKIAPGISCAKSEDFLQVEAANDSVDMRRLHGLYRALIQNMVTGVSQGFEKRLEMIGVGYRAVVQGPLLDIQVGLSHPTKLEIPAGLQVKVEKNTLIAITGIDRQAVGQFAAEIRALRPPEPYQGKGIRYSGEFVRRKAGKAAKSAKK
ncbi:MAG: 50S ribosomal protein L6 [Chlamydia sp.]